MKKILIIFVLFVSIFIITGCGVKKGDTEFGKLSFNKPENVTSENTDNGTLGDEEKWNSIDYTLDGMVITLKQYEKVKMKFFTFDGYKDITINGTSYKYKEEKSEGGFIHRTYCTQVGDDLYYVFATYTDNKTNKEILDTMVKSFVFEK